MPFTVACKACGTRLAIPDSLYDKKIKGRSVTIACKNCGSDIKVDGTKPRGELDVSARTANGEATEPKSAAKSEPQAVAEAEPEAAAKSEPKAAAKAEPEAAAKSEPKAAAKAEPEAAAKSEPKAAAKSEPKPAAKAEPRVEAKVEPKPAAKSEPRAAAKSEPKAAAKSEPKAAAKSEPKAMPVHREASVAARRASPSPVAPKQPSGFGASAPKAKAPVKEELPVDAFWAVSFGDDDDRELTVPQVAAALRRKEIDEETLVWHEGMDEWKPIAEVPELAVHVPRKPETPKPPAKVGSTTLADAPMAKRTSVAGPPPAPSPPAPPMAGQPAPSPFDAGEQADQSESDVVSSVSAAGLAGLAAKVPAREAEPAAPVLSGGALADALSPPEAPPTKPAEPAFEPVPAEAAAFAISNRRRYLPLAVLGVVVLLGIIVLSLGGSSEKEISRDIQAKPAGSQPPRDIRQARRLGEQPEPVATKEAEKPPEPPSRAGQDPLWGEAKPGAKRAEPEDVAKEEAPGGDDIVSAMKKGMERSGKKRKARSK
jgi:hypothetical protein